MSEVITKYSLFSEAYIIWVTNRISTLSEATRALYLSQIPNKLSKFFYNKVIDDITENDINDFIESLIQANYSSDYIYQNFLVISHFFEYLVSVSIIEKSPVIIKYKKVGRHNHEIYLLSLKNIKSIMDNSENSIIRNIIRIILYTGLKVKTLSNLTWNKIDFENHTLTHSDITIPICDEVVTFFLEELKKQYNIKQQNPNWSNVYNFVFTDKSGFSLTTSIIKKEFATIASLCKIDNLKLEHLSDYYIITALRNGVSPNTICNSIGYKRTDAIREHMRIANITVDIPISSEEVSLTDTLYERYLKQYE